MTTYTWTVQLCLRMCVCAYLCICVFTYLRLYATRYECIRVSRIRVPCANICPTVQHTYIRVSCVIIGLLKCCNVVFQFQCARATPPLRHIRTGARRTSSLMLSVRVCLCKCCLSVSFTVCVWLYIYIYIYMPSLSRHAR